MAKQKLVVAGAMGVIGRAVIERIAGHPDWDVIGLSRRTPDYESQASHISVDLLDPEDCRDKLGGLTDVTHLAFAAYIEKLRLADQVAPNLALITNLVRSLQEVAPSLHHVTLFQGGKAYGCHLGPFKTPGKESDPRHMPPNFYYDQEDFLRAESAGRNWTWSALRPEAVCGFAVGNPMNLLMVIAVYAAISKHLGQPMRFPGTEAAYNALYQVSDADILADATLWAGQEPKAAGEIFNITNGDYFRWCHMWPLFADFFGMDYAPPIPINLQDMMSDKRPVWEAITAEHGLKPYDYEAIASWRFGDFIFNAEYDNITSTIKARRLGFHACIDSEEMFLGKFQSLQEMRIIP